MRKLVIVFVVIILLTVGAVWAVSRGGDHQNTPKQASQKATSAGNSQNKATVAVITYGSNGFSPSAITVNSGDKVTIKNESNKQLEFDSDPHPIHTDDPELNQGAISPGSSLIFTIANVGTHGYHNHLNSSDRGTIIVR